MITIDQTNVASVTQAICDMLVNADKLGRNGVNISRSEDIPSDPPGNGWVGVYRNMVKYQLRTSGAYQAGRNHIVELTLVAVQSGESGSDCEDRLETLIKDIMDVLFTDGTFGGTVDMVQEDVVVRYVDFSQNGERYKQVAYIFISGIKRV
jgi:hypothetical protein